MMTALAALAIAMMAYVGRFELHPGSVECAAQRGELGADRIGALLARSDDSHVHRARMLAYRGVRALSAREIDREAGDPRFDDGVGDNAQSRRHT